MPADTKQCCKCSTPKPVDQFARDKRRPDGRHPECKSCQKPRWKKYYRGARKANAAKTRKRYAEHRERYRLNATLRKFKISREAFEALVEQHKGLCSICGQPESRTRHGKPARLNIDHDHKTGKLRGLLCNRCNIAIGLMDDDPTKLMAAINYLEKHREVPNVSREL